MFEGISGRSETSIHKKNPMCCASSVLSNPACYRFRITAAATTTTTTTTTTTKTATATSFSAPSPILAEGIVRHLLLPTTAVTDNSRAGSFRFMSASALPTTRDKGRRPVRWT